MAAPARGVAAARVLLSGALRTPPLGPRVRTASPSSRATLYVVRPDGTLPVRARAGIPSLERALGDPEVSGVASWVDAPSDAAWTSPDPAAVLRAIDRFRPVPDVPARAASWAEWLYFNGRSASARFYLTFLVGPAQADGRRTAGVRLQLDRGRGVESFSATAALDRDAIDAAPELDDWCQPDHAGWSALQPRPRPQRPERPQGDGRISPSLAQPTS